MNECQLFTQPHEELLRIAADLGITNAPALTTGQLVHAIAVAQATEKQGIPWAQTPRIVFRPAERMQTALIRNPADQPVRLSLEAVDRNGAFVIPAEFEDVVLQGRDALSVPVRFSPPIKGVPITNSASYTGAIYIWDRAANCIMATVRLSATGPDYQAAPRLVPSQPRGSDQNAKGLAAPAVYVRATPEWSADPGQTIHVEWSVGGATEVETWIGQPGTGGILEDTEATDWADWGGPPVLTDSSHGASDDFYRVLGSGFSFSVRATNRDLLLTTERHVRACLLQPIIDQAQNQYGSARTPGPVYRSTLNALCGFLRDIENKLSVKNCIRSNEDLWRFWFSDHAPGSSHHYLYGSGPPPNLTQDILTKMNNIIIFTDQFTLPSAGRYVCGDRVLSEIESQQVLCNNYKYGTFAEEWVGICYTNDPHAPKAGAATLLEMLYYSCRADPGLTAHDIIEHFDENDIAQSIMKGCFPPGAH